MKKMHIRRKLAIATWTAPSEGSILGKLVVDAGEALAYIEALRQRTGEKITITHLVGKACALGLAQAPTLNGRLVLGRYVPHDFVNITFLVALEEGQDLAKAKVDHADRKSVAEIASELRARAGKLRDGSDGEYEKSKVILRLLPGWLLRPILWLTGFITGSLGISAPLLGLEAFPFGSCVVTNVGVFGLDEGFAPLTPFAHCPVLVLVGAIRERPAVVDGQVVARPQLTLTATIDHRFIDGSHGAILARVVRDVLENPWQLDAAPPGSIPENQK